MIGPFSVYNRSLVLSMFCPHSGYAQPDKFWLCSVYVIVCVPSIVLSLFCLGSVYIPDLFHQICSLSVVVIMSVQQNLSFDTHNQPPNVPRGGLTKALGNLALRQSGAIQISS